MSKESELGEMVDRFAGKQPEELVSMSVGFLRALHDEIRTDEPLTPARLHRIFARAERVVAEFPQVVDNMEKWSGRAAAAERLADELRHKLKVAERAVGLRVIDHHAQTVNGVHHETIQVGHPEVP